MKDEGRAEWLRRTRRRTQPETAGCSISYLRSIWDLGSILIVYNFQSSPHSCRARLMAILYDSIKLSSGLDMCKVMSD